MALYVYNGKAPKMRAGGYLFKPGVPKEVNEKTLRDRDREQFDKHGIHGYVAPEPVIPATPEDNGVDLGSLSRGELDELLIERGLDPFNFKNKAACVEALAEDGEE